MRYENMTYEELFSEAIKSDNELAEIIHLKAQDVIEDLEGSLKDAEEESGAYDEGYANALDDMRDKLWQLDHGV